MKLLFDIFFKKRQLEEKISFLEKELSFANRISGLNDQLVKTQQEYLVKSQERLKKMEDLLKDTIEKWQETIESYNHHMDECLKLEDQKHLNTHKMCDLAVDYERGEYNDGIRNYMNVSNAADVFSMNCFDDVRQACKNKRNKAFTVSVDFKEKSVILNVLVTAGRVLLRIKTDKITVSILGAEEGERRSGLNSINGNTDDAVDVFNFLVKNWYKIKETILH